MVQSSLALDAQARGRSADDRAAGQPLILKLCLPAVISNLVTTAYNLTDTFFIGQLGTAMPVPWASFSIHDRDAGARLLLL